MDSKRVFSVVPWRNPEQFHNVHKCLYSKSISDKRWAVDQISVWETRCHPSLPRAAEATVILVRAVIQDMLYEVENSLWQAKDVQMAYAMSIIRFYYLMIEIGQDARLAENTCVSLESNLPRWIVQLRHEAVHGKCPSLSLLRMGARGALEFLEETFWKVEAPKVIPFVKTLSNTEQDIAGLILQFRTLQLCRFSAKANKSVLISDSEKVLEKIGLSLRHFKETVLNVLVKPGAFICVDDLHKLLHQTAPLFLDSDDSTQLPETLESFWLPVIRQLHNYNALPCFLEKLLLAQEGPSVDLCSKTAAAWISRILISTKNVDNPNPAKLDKLLKEKPVHLDLHRLLYACMKGINKYLITVFSLLVNELGDKQRYSQLYCMVALYQGWFVKNAEGGRSTAKKNEEIIFTAADAEEDIEEMKAHQRSKRLKRDNIWSPAPLSLDFSKIPLGAILNPVVYEPSPEIVEQEKEQKFILINENHTNYEAILPPPPSPFQRPDRSSEIKDLMYRRNSDGVIITEINDGEMDDDGVPHIENIVSLD